MPDLGRTSHTLACRDGFSDGRYRYASRSVIERTINSCDVPLLLMHPLEQGADLIQCQGGRQAARQIHMDFIRAPRGIGAQFAHSAQAVGSHPGQRIPPEATLGLAPVSAQYPHGLLRIARQDRKRQPINREGEARIHGTYRTPVMSAVGSAPVLPRRGPFRSAPQPAGMRRGPASPPDGVTDSTVFSVLPVSI